MSVILSRAVNTVADITFLRAYLEHNLSTNEGKLETELSQNHKNIAEGNNRSETKRPPSLYKFTNLNVAAK